VGKKLERRRTVLPDVGAEMTVVFALWAAAFGGVNAKEQERSVKVVLTAELLRRWFGDAMLHQCVHVPDLTRASVIDLLRILDYPSEFVPVMVRRASPASQAVRPFVPLGDLIQLVDKSALNAQLAESYVTELMDRARIA
jgi:hypothetical protein